MTRESPGKGGGLEKNLEATIDATIKFIPPPPQVYDFSRYVCQITKETIDGSPVAGTGFLVASDLVLTCFHVVENTPPERLECRFDVKTTEQGHTNFGPKAKVKEVLSTSSYSELEKSGQYKIDSETHPSKNELDYALLKLNENVGLETVELQQGVNGLRGWLNLPSVQPDVDNTATISILQHPGGRGQQAAVGKLVSVQPISGTRIRYLANTQNGSSGSPCFQWSSTVKNRLELVALHNYGDPGYGHQTGFNQGVPVHLIAADIKKDNPNVSKIMEERPPQYLTEDRDGKTFLSNKLIWVVLGLALIGAASYGIGLLGPNENDYIETKKILEEFNAAREEFNNAAEQ